MKTKKIHLARHFKSFPVKRIPDQMKHVDLVAAREQAKIFRAKLEAEQPHFNLVCYSTGIRSGYCLLFATMGIADNARMMQIPHVYPENGVEKRIMQSAYRKNHGDIAKYSDKEIQAVDALGGLGAEAIFKAIVEAELQEAEHLEALVFGHAPTLNAIAARLLGTTLLDFPNLRFDLGEGSRITVDLLQCSYQHC